MLRRERRKPRREEARQSSLGKRTEPQPSMEGSGKGLSFVLAGEDRTDQPMEEWPISKENERYCMRLRKLESRQSNSKNLSLRSSKKLRLSPPLRLLVFEIGSPTNFANARCPEPKISRNGRFRRAFQKSFD